MRYAQDFGFAFSAYTTCFAVSLPHTLIFFFSELTHAFSFHADIMLGKNMLADLKALARNHGLATGSQTVPNSAVRRPSFMGDHRPRNPPGARNWSLRGLSEKPPKSSKRRKKRTTRSQRMALSRKGRGWHHLLHLLHPLFQPHHHH